MNKSKSVYDQLVGQIFSGNVSPGTKLVEQNLAKHLGVSRIPIRESLGKMVGQGLLVSEQSGRGVRVRNYTSEEIRQLFEYREMLEGGAASAAARAATSVDIINLETICQQAEKEVGNYGSQQWANLDHAFHIALAEASHNDRIIHSMKLFLTESHYIFYLYPPQKRTLKPSQEDATAHMQSVVDCHRRLIDLISKGDAEGASREARSHIKLTGEFATQVHAEQDHHIKPDESFPKTES